MGMVSTSPVGSPIHPMTLPEHPVAFEVTKHLHGLIGVPCHTCVGPVVENNATQGDEPPFYPRPSGGILHHRQEFAA